MRHPGIVVLLAAVSVTACTTNENALDISGPTSDRGQVVIDVKVNGDPSSTSRNFDLFVNDEYAGPANLNDRHYFTRIPGDYRISIVPRADLFFAIGLPSWCFISEGNPSIVHIGKDSTSTLTLEVECPPFAGNARIRIHGATTGPNAPPEVNYLVGRVHPWQQDWPSSSMRIPVGGVQELSGEPGIYMIVPDAQSGKCDPTLGSFFFGGVFPLDLRGYVVVRNGQVVDVNNELRCP